MVRGALPGVMTRLIRAQDIALNYRLADWGETIGKGLSAEDFDNKVDTLNPDGIGLDIGVIVVSFQLSESKPGNPAESREDIAQGLKGLRKKA